MYVLYRMNIMAYEKTFDLLDLAIWMQSTREGISLSDIMNRFQVSRRTAERMRDMILSRFPQVVEEIGENNSKRWYIPQGTLKDFIQFSADDIACLNLAKDALIKEKLSDKAVMWGLGKNTNEFKQPIDALNANDMYREYDAYFVGDKDPVIYLTFDEKDVYPSIEEKCVNFFYMIIKNHVFIDGNKRIAATLFIYFLKFYNLFLAEQGIPFLLPAAFFPDPAVMQTWESAI